MATIRREIPLEVSAAVAWDVVRDVIAVDKRLVPGFVTESLPDPDTSNGVARLVTFFNGPEVREPLVSYDDTAWRLIYGATGGRAIHYSAAVQVFDKRPAHRRSSGRSISCRTHWLRRSARWSVTPQQS